MNLLWLGKPTPVSPTPTIGLRSRVCVAVAVWSALSFGACFPRSVSNGDDYSRRVDELYRKWRQAKSASFGQPKDASDAKVSWGWVAITDYRSLGRRAGSFKQARQPSLIVTDHRRHSEAELRHRIDRALLPANGLRSPYRNIVPGINYGVPSSHRHFIPGINFGVPTTDPRARP
ncbi:hypothetical protein Mal65_48140 [Crateriforma conspicua]|nr:hypothetical protein Mal65_48140 [Crateriforma conspicua]